MMKRERKLSLEQLKENFDIQLDELESLQSVFCNPGEIKVEDVCTLAEMKNFVNGLSKLVPPYLDILVNLTINNLKLELSVTLPHEYPNIEPEILVRNNKLSRSQHIQLNKDLNDYVSSLDRGEPCIFNAISWVQDNSQNYVVLETECNSVKKIEKDSRLIRYWIYSHHIYSKSKRREIVDLAQSLHITGFCMPGKPGVICVEGLTSDCNDWWQTIKSMNWKRIFCKVTEEDKDDTGNSFLKFNCFEEVVFQNSGVKCNHMDMGELFKYLEEHNVGYIFKEIFGVDAKQSPAI